MFTRSPDPTRPVLPQRRWETSGAAAVLGLDQTQRSLLVGYGGDQLLEAMWARWAADDLPSRIANIGFDLVTSPDFSVYADQPRAEQLFNARRSLVAARDLAAAGCNVAPTIYAGRRDDLDRWLRWIADVEPSWIFLPRHTLRLDRDWQAYAEPALTYLAAFLPPAVQIVMSGVATGGRIRWLNHQFGPRIHIATQAPVQHATHQSAVVGSGRTPVAAQHPDLVAHNLRALAGMVETHPPSGR